MLIYAPVFPEFVMNMMQKFIRIDSKWQKDEHMGDGKLKPGGVLTFLHQ